MSGKRKILPEDRRSKSEAAHSTAVTQKIQDTLREYERKWPSPEMVGAMMLMSPLTMETIGWVK